MVKREVAQSGGAGGSDAVLGSGTLALPQFQGGDRGSGGVGREARQAHTVGVGEPQLRTGVRAFFADDQPHTRGPSLEDVAGQLGDPGAAADLAVGFDRRGPG